MKIVCAWCGEHQAHGSGNGVSHGICKPCEANVLKELKQAKEKRSKGKNNEREKCVNHQG